MKTIKKNHLIAAIDIGSHALCLKIAETSKDNEIKIIENLRKTISLGKDTFAMGQVSFETVEETCKILQSFRQCLADYNVREYRTVATSAVREAKNRDYIIDQIKLKTGLSPKVLENSEERFLTMKAIMDAMPNYATIRKGGAIIVDIGSGSIQTSIYYDGRFEITQNIRLGSLRIREILSSLETRTLDFPKVLEEYIEGNIDNIGFVKYSEEFNDFVVIGSEIPLISQLCNRKTGKSQTTHILKKDFEEVYKEILYKSPQVLKKELAISQENAEILLPSMMLLKKFFDHVKADKAYTPMISLADGVLSDICGSRAKKKGKDPLGDDILSLARCIGTKFNYHEAHAIDVEEKSVALFEGLRKLHGMGDRELFLLRLSAILHDTGKYINLNDHYIHSYHIVMASELMGISRQELEIIANVSRYHSREVPSQSHATFMRLNEADRVVTAKLVAIIRIADALDRSHRQKIKSIKVTLDNEGLTVRVDTKEDVLLEEWTFETKANFFREVFGVVPIMKIKREMPNAGSRL
ncbi:MAG: HD domain-containing protein [Eubacteriales bacterium]